MEDKIVKTSEIQIKVGLNENNLPIGMKWSAADGQMDNAPASAFILVGSKGKEHDENRSLDQRNVH